MIRKASKRLGTTASSSDVSLNSGRAVSLVRCRFGRSLSCVQDGAVDFVFPGNQISVTIIWTCHVPSWQAPSSTSGRGSNPQTGLLRWMLKTGEKRHELSNFEGVEDLRDVLEEVLRLLEEYGPAWYSEDLRNRIVSALVKAPRRAVRGDSATLRGGRLHSTLDERRI